MLTNVLVTQRKVLYLFSDDDWRAPTFIERLVEILESNSEYGCY